MRGPGEIYVLAAGMNAPVSTPAPPRPLRAAALWLTFLGPFFFLTYGAANWLAHFAGGYWGTMTPTAYFMIFGVVAAAATVLMLSMSVYRRHLYAQSPPACRFNRPPAWAPEPTETSRANQSSAHP